MISVYVQKNLDLAKLKTSIETSLNETIIVKFQSVLDKTVFSIIKGRNDIEIIVEIIDSFDKDSTFLSKKNTILDTYGVFRFTNLSRTIKFTPVNDDRPSRKFLYHLCAVYGGYYTLPRNTVFYIDKKPEKPLSYIFKYINSKIILLETSTINELQEISKNYQLSKSSKYADKILSFFGEVPKIHFELIQRSIENEYTRRNILKYISI